MTKIAFIVNGAPVSADVEDRTLLVYFLREHLHLTGTHIGCDTSQCGACVVHVDGKAVKSCSLFAVQADGRDVELLREVEQSLQAVERDRVRGPRAYEGWTR